MPGIKFAITADSQQALSAFESIQRGVSDMSRTVQQAGVGIDDIVSKLNSIGSLVGVGFGVQQVQSFLGKVKEVRSYFQDIESSMEVFLGSQERAANFTQKLKDYAYYNMFEFSDLAAASKQMIAYHTDAEDVIPVLDKLSNIATGTQADLMDLVNMYNNAKSIGTLGAQQLAQWATRGVLVKDTLREMGETLQTTGHSTVVTFEQLEKVLDKVTGEGGMFHDLMLNQMENISAEAGQLEDNLANMYNEIGEHYQEYITGFIKKESEVVDWITENYQEIGQVIFNLVAAYGTYKAALITVNAVQKSMRNYNADTTLKGLQEEIDAYKALIPVKEKNIDEELKEKVALGQLTEEQAKLIKLKYEELDVAQKAATSAGGSKGLSLLGGSAEEIADYEKLLGLQQQAKIQSAEIMQAVQNGDITVQAGEEIQKQLDTLQALRERVSARREELEVIADTKAAELEEAQQRLSSAMTWREQMDENLAKRREEYEAAKEYADIDQTNLEDALSGVAAAESAANTAAKEEEAAANAVLEASEAAKTAQEELSTFAEQANTIAENANTTAKNMNTTATNVEGAAVARESLITRGATIAKTMFAAAINSVKNAFNAMKVAMMTNPLGAIITVVTTAITLFQIFGEEEDEVAQMTERFGESMEKASQNVETLFAVLQTVETGSQAYRDALAELRKEAEKYGINLDEEIEKTDDLIKVKGQLINLIREEAQEREKANAIDAISEAYNRAIETAGENLKDELDVDNAEQVAVALKNLIPQETLDRITELRKRMKDARTGSEEYREAHHALQQEMISVNEVAKVFSQRMGYEKRDTDDVRLALSMYVTEVSEAKIAQEESTSALDEATKKTQEVANATGIVTDAQRALAASIRDSKKDSSELRAELDRLISEYQNMNLRVTITYKEIKVPAWMKGLSKDEKLRMGEYYKQKAEKASKTGHKLYNGVETLDASQLAERSLQYIKSAREDTKAEEDAKKRRPTTTPTTKKSGSGKKFDAAQAAAEQEEMRREYQENLDKLVKEWVRDAIDSQLSIEHAYEALGFTEIEQMRLTHEDVIVEINREAEEKKRTLEEKIEEEINKRKELDKKLWLKGGANRKSKDYKQEKTDEQYRAELLGTAEAGFTALGKAYNQQLASIQSSTLEKISKEDYEYSKKINEYRRSEIESMASYLQEYGNLRQREYAITTSYNEKIKKAQEENASAFEIESLRRQQEEALKSLEFESFKENINWDGLFNDLDKFSEEFLQNTRSKLKELLESGTLSIEEMEIVAGKIHDVDDAINAERGSLINFVNPAWEEQKRLIAESEEAQKRLTKATAEEAEAAKETLKARNVLTESLNGKDIGNLEISFENKEAILSKLGIDPTSDEFKKLSQAFDNLAISEAKLADKTKKREKAQAKAESAADKATQDLSEKIATWLKGLNQWVNDYLGDLPDLLNEIGLGDAGAKVQSGLNAVNSAAGAAADFASGNYIGAALKGVQAIKSFGEVLGIGGNEAEVAKTTERLTKSNEELAERIDDLKDAIGDSAGAKALFAYETALEAQETINSQQMEILRAQMKSHGLWKKSNAGSIDDRKIASYNEDAQRAFQAAGVHASTISTLNSIYNLTPEQLKAIKDFAPELWKYLTTTGRYDKSEYWENVVELAGKTEELTEQIQKNLTQTSFDDLRGNFLDTLTDMESDSKDFAKNLENQIFKALVNKEILDDNFSKWLELWYNRYSEAIKNGSKSTLKSLEDEYVDRFNSMVKERDALASALNISGMSSFSQSGTEKGYSGSFTQDSMDEFNGRMTTSNTLLAQVLQNAIHQAETADVVSLTITESNVALKEIRNLHIQSNEYLEDIAQSSRKQNEILSQNLYRIADSLSTL